MSSKIPRGYAAAVGASLAIDAFSYLSRRSINERLSDKHTKNVRRATAAAAAGNIVVSLLDAQGKGRLLTATRIGAKALQATGAMAKLVGTFDAMRQTGNTLRAHDAVVNEVGELVKRNLAQQDTHTPVSGMHMRARYAEDQNSVRRDSYLPVVDVVGVNEEGVTVQTFYLESEGYIYTRDEHGRRRDANVEELQQMVNWFMEHEQ